MRGGGKVNYTSGTLARAKARSKTSQSPNRPYKCSSSALFPQKILIPSPIRQRAATQSSIDIGTEIELYEPSQHTSSPLKAKKEVRSRDDWSDSDSAMFRRAGDTSRGDGVEGEEGRAWWIGYGRESEAGKQYQVELDRIMAKEQKRNRVSEDDLDKKSQKVKRKSSLAVTGRARKMEGLFDRPDCLDTPHWLRLLPRKAQPIGQADGGEGQRS